MAVGGDAVARDGSGRVVFVHGALPGERVLAAVNDERKTFARATVVEVLDPSLDRRTPPCAYASGGCGGCDWQHIAPGAQRDHRRASVVECLQRLGGIDDPAVLAGAPLATERYRTTVRCGVVGGRAAYRRRRSHDLLPVEDCLVAHPLVVELIEEGRFGSAREVTLRVGARTSERLVVAHPTAEGVVLPEGTRVVGTRELTNGRRAWYHEEVAGRRWRISATSFFQSRPDGAEALVQAVGGAVDELAPEETTMVDLCSGVGLFAGTIGNGRRIVAVERHAAAAADARHNLADQDVRHVRTNFEQWRPSPAGIVVADPARSGLGTAGVATVVATGATAVVLVSCDPAALGRDASLLGASGYSYVGSVLVDLFPHTAHVETVSRFIRR